MLRLSLILSCLVVLLASCSNEVNINDDYQEQAVMYALLNPEDSIQTVRVQKSFLGEGNVNDMGEVSDSIYFSDEIVVTIQEIQNGNPVGDAMVLVAETLTKDEGDFATANHVVYRTENQDGILDSEKQYRVKMRNTVTGYEAYGDTYLVGDYNLLAPNTPVINFNATSKMALEWEHADHTGVYQVVLRFHYEEDGELMYLDMPFNQRDVGVDYNNPGVFEQFERGRFWTYLQNNIEPSLTKKRIAIGIEILVYAGGTDYTLFTDLNASSGTLVEERPEFTNVVNGTGLVSSRSVTTSEVMFILNNDQDYYNLAPSSLDTLVCGYRTKDLHFGKIMIDGFGADTVYCNN